MWTVSSGSGQPWVQFPSNSGLNLWAHLFSLFLSLLSRCNTLTTSFSLWRNQGNRPSFCLARRLREGARESSVCETRRMWAAWRREQSSGAFSLLLMVGEFAEVRQSPAARSASSFPGMLTWLGIQTRDTWVPAELKLKMMSRMEFTVFRLVGLLLKMDCRDGLESEKIWMEEKSLLYACELTPLKRYTTRSRLQYKRTVTSKCRCSKLVTSSFITILKRRIVFILCYTRHPFGWLLYSTNF